MRTRSVTPIALLAALAVLCLVANGIDAHAAQEPGPKVIHAEITAEQLELAKGPEMYESLCAACHAGDGTGRGPAATPLAISPTDLTRLATNNGGEFPGVRTLNTILGDPGTGAHGSRDMPAYGRLLRLSTERPAVARQKAWILTRHIESIQTPAVD